MNTLRERLHSGRVLLAPGVWDGLTARLVEEAGFEAAFLTGSGVSISHLGQPDLGLVTLTEMVTRAERITAATSLPVVVDGDTGHGNAVNVVRTVRELERAGAAAVVIEDQVFPKRCGHMGGRRDVVPVRQAALEIEAAVHARGSDGPLVVARTDARRDHGIDEAIARARAYREAGADALFVEAPESEEELAAIGDALRGVPLVANMVEGGTTPVLSAAALEAYGVRLVIYPTTLCRTFVPAARRALAALRERGVGSSEGLASWGDVNELVGASEAAELERRFLPGDDR